MKNHSLNDLAQRWMKHADWHEEAAKEHDKDQEEINLHLESAKVLRTCATELEMICE